MARRGDRFSHGAEESQHIDSEFAAVILNDNLKLLHFSESTSQHLCLTKDNIVSKVTSTDIIN